MIDRFRAPCHGWLLRSSRTWNVPSSNHCHPSFLFREPGFPNEQALVIKTNLHVDVSFVNVLLLRTGFLTFGNVSAGFPRSFRGTKGSPYSYTTV